jgi:hypothetical protein
MAAAEELKKYYEFLEQRVPAKAARFLRWLRKPSSLWARVVVAFLLIFGGIFSFLPVLGLWMLPLGLILIAQDVPGLQEPLLAALRWTEGKWKRVKSAWNGS